MEEMAVSAVRSSVRTTYRVSDRSFKRIANVTRTRGTGLTRREIAELNHDPEEFDTSRTEMDNHADTCVVGQECLVFHDFDRPVNVAGFDTSLGTVKNRSVVSAAVAYDDPTTGEVIMLVVHQAIYIPTMDHNLLCPMQIRMNDHLVDECPKFLHPRPNDDTHAIKFSDTSEDPGYRIPLQLFGVTSYFPTRKPTQEEWDNC
jgi:hypothetical protein